jgi:hypothetical protein
MLRVAVLVLGFVAFQSVLQSASVIKLRPPRSFAQLPPIVQETLVAEGCGIPESGFSLPRVKVTPSTNVIQGQFAASGQDDWAVLCTKRGRTSIRVFWGGAASCPAQFEGRPSEYEINIDGPDGPYFDRTITGASPARIREAHGRYGAEVGQKLPKSLHDGIEDGSEKASSIHFCDNGRWLRLVGAD